MSHPPRLTPLLALTPLLTLALASCTEVGPRRGENKAAVALRDEPRSGLPVDGILIVAPSNFSDTDENGYCDTAEVIVHLISSTSETPSVAVEGDGAFEITLFERGGRKLAQWQFTAEEAKAVFVPPRTVVGWGYAFTININKVASDEIRTSDGRLQATYLPREGRPVSTPNAASVVIGPQRMR